MHPVLLFESNSLNMAAFFFKGDVYKRQASDFRIKRLGASSSKPRECAAKPDSVSRQLRGLPPFFSPKYDLKQHPNYRYTAEYDSKRNAFHLERLLTRRLRLKPEEEYTVYEVDTSDEDADILNYDDLDSADDFV